MSSNRMEKIDTAFVLGGGGNRGAIQAGALLALVQHGIIPQLLVGTSSGALNAVQIAAEPTVAGAEKLIAIWRGTGRELFRRTGYLTIGRNLVLKKDSLSGNENLKQYVAKNIPPGISTFADFTRAQLRVIATELDTGQWHVFGNDAAESVLDALMASTALPVYMPPWEYRGIRYVDGGVVSALPVMTALQYKPRRIYVLDISPLGEAQQPRVKGMINIVNRTIDIMIQHQVRHELEGMAMEGVEAVYHIGMNTFTRTPLWNMSRLDEMIAAGQQIISDFLSQEHPSGYIKYNAPQSK